MAEAIAALGLAANILQLVDYSLQIVSTAKQLSKSVDGAIPEHHHTSVVTTNFRDASATLSTYLEKCDGAEKGFGSENTQLRTLSSNCEVIARELLEELDRLKLRTDGKNVRWHSLRHALKITLGRDKVDALAGRLEMYRQELKTEIPMEILRGQGITHTRLQDIDQIVKKILQETLVSRQLSEENFSKMMKNLANAHEPVKASTLQPDDSVLKFVASMDNQKLATILASGAHTETTDKEGCTALILASRAGRHNNVLTLLKAGANIEARNVHGATPLREAAKMGHLTVVQLLLSWEARLWDFNAPYHATALDKALEKEKWETAKLLLEKGDRVLKSGRILPTKLCSCAEQNKQDDALGVSVLIQAGVNIDNARNSRSQSPLLIASHNGHTEIVKILLAAQACTESRDDNGYTALSLATLKGYLEIVRMLLQAGANPNALNKSGWSVLAEASYHGWPEIIDELIARGAYLDTRDEGNYTPLLLAAQQGHLPVVESLLEHGAKTSAQNKDGWTSLAEASYAGRLDIVKLLLEWGANVELSGGPNPGDSEPEDRWTPLMRAARGGHLSIVKALVEAGAKIDAWTSGGKSALTISEARQDKVYDFLLRQITDNSATHLAIR